MSPATTSPPNLHPYFPPHIRLSGEQFTANGWDAPTLVLAFGAGSAVIAAVTLGVVRRVNPGLKGVDEGLVLWFVLCE